MNRPRLPSLLFIPVVWLMALPAMAAPKVVTDIAPVQSLAARVMAGVGTPELIVPPGVSAHHYSMRPSEAAKLSRADIVFWIGEGLSPGFAKAVSSLAPQAISVALMEVPGVTLLEYGDDSDHHEEKDHHEESAGKDHHEHQSDGDRHHHEESRREVEHAYHEEREEHHHEASEKEEHDHDHHSDGDRHHHEESEREVEHAHHEEREEHHHEASEKDEHGHEHHGDIDPHIWLDPVNAKAMISEMAARLAKIDPRNAATYRANAAAAASELDSLIGRVVSLMAPVREREFVTAHDGYAYFAHRFDLEYEGAVALGDASSPGPARIAMIKRTIKDHDVACLFVEPQLDNKLARTVAEGTGVRLGVIDPFGSEPGPDLYPDLIEGLAQSMHRCLSGDRS